MSQACTIGQLAVYTSLLSLPNQAVTLFWSLSLAVLPYPHAFSVQIYVRVSLRESLAEWRSVLQNIMESSPTATQLLLTFLSCSDSQRLEEHLLNAQVPACFVYIASVCCSAACIAEKKINNHT